MMYAVISSGGKQYRVAPGDTIKVETLDADVGGDVTFEQVLMTADGDNIKVGTPYLSGVTVQGEVVNHGRGKKVHVLKFHRRKHHMKQMGHRQNYTEVKIRGINDGA